MSGLWIVDRLTVDRRRTPPPPSTTPPVVAHDITQPIAWTDDIFMTKELVKPLNYVKWGAFGRGPLVSPGCDHGAFVKTEAKLPEADLQVRNERERGRGGLGSVYACLSACLPLCPLLHHTTPNLPTTQTPKNPHHLQPHH